MRSAARTGTGLGLALIATATFGTSGSFASSLIDAGWTPGAAVAVRISVAALVLAIPALISLRGHWHLLRSNARLMTGYGLVAVAGCQICFFHAVKELSVGVALLLEYLGVIMLVGWLWLRHGHRPRALTVAGSALAVLGLVFVLDVLGGVRISLVGVLWGLAAAVGLATFFVLSAKTEQALPPVAMASIGMGFGGGR